MDRRIFIKLSLVLLVARDGPRAVSRPAAAERRLRLDAEALYPTRGASGVWGLTPDPSLAQGSFRRGAAGAWGIEATPPTARPPNVFRESTGVVGIRATGMGGR